MNYNLKMEEMIENIPAGTSLLLHACCAPCSSACLERLANHFKVTIYFYNPNITEETEYNKRINEVKRFVKEFNTTYSINVIDGKFNPDKFFAMSKGLENEPERGIRCYKCYKLRLEWTAILASKLDFDYFTTTLSLSPYKNSEWINEIGSELDNKYESTFLYSDFKKKNGYKRSIELSKEYNLYRQDYCGCIYSKRDRLKCKINKKS